MASNNSTRDKLRQQVFDAVDLKETTVDAPAWGTKFLLRELTAAQRALLISDGLDVKTGRPKLDKLYPLIVIMSARDPESGELVFELADRDMLMSKSGKTVEQVAMAAMELNGLSAEAADAATKSA